MENEIDDNLDQLHGAAKRELPSCERLILGEGAKIAV